MTSAGVSLDPSITRGSPDEAADHGDVTIRGRRRQKIAIACEECRARRVRCDGRRPECTVCMRKRLSCRYPVEKPKSTNSSRVMIESLQSRLEQVEGLLVRERAAREAETSTTVLARDTPHSMPSTALNPGSPATDQPETRTHDDVPMHEDDDGASFHAAATCRDESRSIDAAGIVNLPHDAPGEFYGRSSAASLLSHVHGHFHGHDLSPRSQFEPSMSESGASKSHPSRIPDWHLPHTDDFNLPPRQMADHLLDIYRSKVQCLYPYLHWPTFMEGYRLLWMSESEARNIKSSENGFGLGGPQCPRPVFYWTLNIMFALAIQVSDWSEHERRERARPFAHRARHLLRLDNLDYGHAALVQAMLVMALYLQSADLRTRCWHVAGVALRMAQGLGFHLEVEREMPPLVREMRRRIWYGCAWLDVTLAMTLGRPTLSSRSFYVKLPGTLEEEMSNKDYSNGIDSTNNLAAALFFTQTSKLTNMLERILIQIYDPWREGETRTQPERNSQEPATSQHIACLIALESDLDTFAATIPENLRWTAQAAEVEMDRTLQAQKNVLRTRLLHCRVMVHRVPFVHWSRELSADPPSNLETAGNTPMRTEHGFPRFFLERSTLACIESAEALIEHINITTQGGKTGVPWSNAYYVYHAVIVLILAELCPPIRQQLPQPQLLHAWKACLAYVDSAIKVNPRSSKYLHALKELTKYIDIQKLETAAMDSVAGESAIVGAALQDLNRVLNLHMDPLTGLWPENTLERDAYAHYGENELGFGFLDGFNSTMGFDMFPQV